MTEHRNLVLLLLMAVAPAVDAHLLKVFAYAEGPWIEGSAYFAGGGGAGGARVEIRSADGRLLAEPQPDAEGRFRYRVQARVDHRVVAETGDGHRAEWLVHAEELAGAPPAGGGAPAAGGGAPAAPSPPPATVPSPAAEGDLAALVEQAVARQLRPLREELRRHQEQVRLRDILGGLGYLLGLAGLGLWWRGRGGR